MELTREDRIKTVFGGGGHVVILGAGASIASSKRSPLPGGKQLPSMDNFIDIVGLRDIVNILPDDLKAENFEDLYSKLHNNHPRSKFLNEIEVRVYDYFKEMTLPNKPTIYDHMVLSLRPRDVIATFNWDPFLYQAWSRNRHVADLPYIAYLHGNVSIGFSKKDNRFGPAGMYSKATLNYYEPTKLLYPVANKNYNKDEFIVGQWEMLNSFLSEGVTKRVTIFGYGAPETDKEAVELLNKAWRLPSERDVEQFEIIDVIPEDQAYKRWKKFIHTHHYDYVNNYFDSSLASNPRRTFESYHQHNFSITEDEAWSESNPIPSDFKTLQELWDWHKPLVKAEEEWKKQNKNLNT
jgi:hypothetical protein